MALAGVAVRVGGGRFGHRLAAALAAAGAGTLAGCSSAPRRAATDLPADAATEVVMLAMSYLDTPYRRGGNAAETGFDCSGFTRHVFERSTGLVLPRTAAEQARFGALREVEADELLPGDLVFFNTLVRPFSHVGICIDSGRSPGRFIHAPRPGTRVRAEDLRSRYWAERFDGARRARVALAAAAPAPKPDA